MSLYDDASLVMIPSAIEDGKLYNVKPKPIPISGELVTNGDFATDSDWTKGTGWSISGGKASCDGTQTSNSVFYQFIQSQSNKIVKFSFSVSDYINGTLETSFFGASGTQVYSITSNGDYTFYINIQSGHNGNTGFTAKVGFQGSIDNVSIIEVDELPADFTFNRGSNLAATRVNKNGLIEKGRENLLLYSNQFDTTWATNCNLTSGQLGYDGTNDAWLLEKDATGFRNLYQNISTFTGVGTLSIYAKANSNSNIIIRCIGGADAQGFFDLSNGTLAASSVNCIDAQINAVGNGWYRCSIVFLTSSTTSVNLYPDYPFGSTSAGSIYIQDAQLEQGLVATDYIESGATTGKAGILEDLPRLDYSGGASCPSLLLEPTRTNFLLASEYFDLSTGWNRGGTITQTNNYGISPEGKKNSTRLQLGNDVLIYRGLQAPFDGARSLYVKATSGSGTIQLLSHYTNTDNIFTIDENWQRVELTDVQQVSQNFYLVDTRGGSNTTIFDIEVWGAQYELGDYSTSYIPCYGSATTRSEDDCQVEDLQSNGIVGNTWTYFFEWGRYVAERNFEMKNSLNSIFLFMVSRMFRYNNDAGGVSTLTTLPSGVNEGIKVVVRYDGSSLKVFRSDDITNEVTDMNASQFDDFDLLRLDRGNPDNEEFKQLVIFPTALTDQECIELTTI